MTDIARPLTLLILDGFGYNEAREHNAIAQADTPNLDKLWSECPHELLSASGEGVGLPVTQMGNSEVGHLNLGAGRVVYQEFSRIGHAIATGEFFKNVVLVNAIDQAVQNHKAVHVLGLLSAGGVHSHVDHIAAAIKLAAQRGAKQVYIHAILDGRDAPPKSAEESIRQVEQVCAEAGVGQIVSLVGRYYAMDRDQRWDRIQKAYRLLTEGQAQFSATTALEGVQAAYERGETDEFVEPTQIRQEGVEPVTLEDGEAVLFMNFRADRARQLTRSFIDQDFTGFERQVLPSLSSFVCLTQYDAGFDALVAFPPAQLQNVFAQCLSNAGRKQLHIAETEKYAHVTFFFNGGKEEPFPGEERELIPSPQVATYDLKPEMSAFEVTSKVLEAIESGHYDCIICNYANADMVGHTGNFAATVKAVECLDRCIGEIAAVLKSRGGELIITADHGNADRMYDEQIQQSHTAHTLSPVPFIYMGRPAKVIKHNGILADIAPTMLYLLGLSIPEEMTGQPLVELM